MEIVTSLQFEKGLRATGGPSKQLRIFPCITFMDIPPEVRDMVYNYAISKISLHTCTHTYCFPVHSPVTDPECDNTAYSLLLVNKAIRLEVSERLLHNCELYFDNSNVCSGHAAGVLKLLPEIFGRSANILWQNPNSAFFSKIRIIWFSTEFPQMLHCSSSALSGALRELSFFGSVQTINIVQDKGILDIIRGDWSNYDLVEGKASTLTTYTQTLLRDGSVKSLKGDADRAIATLPTVYAERTNADSLRELLLPRSADGQPRNKYPVSIRVYVRCLLCLCGARHARQAHKANHTSPVIVYDWDTQEILAMYGRGGFMNGVNLERFGFRSALSVEQSRLP